MKKLLIYKDNSRIKDFHNKIEYVQGYLNEFYQKLVEWKLDGIKWSYDDLVVIVSGATPIQRITPTLAETYGIRQSMFDSQNPQGNGLPKVDYTALSEIITDHLKTRAVSENEQPKVFGFRLSKAKLKEMIEVPEPPIELLEALDAACGSIRQKFDGSLDYNYFMVSRTAILLNRDMLLEFEEKCCYYATTKKEVSMAEQMFQVCESLNKFKEFGNGLFVLKVEAMNCSRNALMEKDGMFYPDYNFIKTFGG